MSGTTTRTLAALAVCTSLLLAVQVGKAALLPFLPNVELVSLLIMLYTLVFRRKVLYIIYLFTLLEGVIYGFHMWWVTYLYIWTVLAALTWLCRAIESPWLMAALSGVFGLFFGALDAIPYLFIGGVPMAVSRWLSGIPFDLIHCAGNFVLCLVLWKPLKKALGFCMERLTRQA
ncbi:MAG: hypothetical protein LBH95_02210 [Oscillospiraceae bacterium]|jgi:energy-coupling factor transport system substrate-specific component|nr:hypothetical protein [Oscillospiraceae bacterium]